MLHGFLLLPLTKALNLPLGAIGPNITAIDDVVSGSGITLPAPPIGYAYVIDNSGRYLLWKKTVSAEASYLLVRIN